MKLNVLWLVILVVSTCICPWSLKASNEASGAGFKLVSLFLGSISLTEPEGDFDHSTLASEGKLQSLEFRKVNLLFQILALVELVFD